MTDDKKEILRLAEKLIEFKTVKENPDQLQQCMDFLESYLDGNSFVIKRYERNNKPSMVISFEDTKKPELMLLGHIDVVEGPEELFSPTIKYSRLYGRGSADMKGSVACMVKAMNDLAKLDDPPSIALMLVSDEETGGKDGAQYLVEEEEYRPSFLIAGEPTGYSTGHLTIAISHKGFLHVKIEATGKSAHGSRPWKGENAIEKLIHKYRDIKKLFEPTTPENRWKATLNLGRIHGGKAINQLPDHAEMDLDIRYTKETPPEEIIDRLEAIEDIDVTVIARGSVSHTSPDHPRIHALKNVTEDIADTECGFHRLHGSADSRFFAAEGVSCVEFGPVGTNLHSIDEYVTIPSLVDYHRIIKAFAQQEG